MREVVSWMVQGFLGNSAITNLVGADSAGNPAIFDQETHTADQNIPYPHLTVSRVGTPRVQRLILFDEQPDTAGRFDNPNIAICAWSQTTRDAAYQIYELAQAMLLGQTAMRFTSLYFSGYKITRGVFRGDLFDREAQAYRVYGEFSMWAQLTDTAQPY
jgi:hypothetical protein